MKECKTMTELSIRNANKRICNEDFLYRILKISKEEAKKMYPSKPSVQKHEDII